MRGPSPLAAASPQPHARCALWCMRHSVSSTPTPVVPLPKGVTLLLLLLYQRQPPSLPADGASSSELSAKSFDNDSSFSGDDAVLVTTDKTKGYSQARVRAQPEMYLALLQVAQPEVRGGGHC